MTPRRTLLGVSLAQWLAKNHPDVLIATLRQAHSSTLSGCGCRHQVSGLGDDTSDTTYYDDTVDTFTPAVTDDTTGVFSSLSNSDLLNLPATINPIVDIPPPDLSSSESNVWVPQAASDSGPSVGSSIASGIGSALSAVGSYLASPTGLKTLATVGTAYLNANAASSNAAAQQAVLQTQIARINSGQPAAAIGYTVSASGQVVPYVQTTGGAVIASPQALAALTPSGFTAFVSQYGLWLLLGGLAFALATQ